MSQASLKYNADSPEGQWLLLRDDISAADADFVATQTRPPDDLELGTPPPGPSVFDGIRFFLEFYSAGAVGTAIPGGTWDAQPIEVGILPPISGVNEEIVLGGEVITPLASLEVVTLGGWRSGVISIRVAAMTLAPGANRARIYVREF